jgi:hypothetical protein
LSNYTKATNFAIKDGLTTTDPAKVIKGTEIDNEYNAISSAISSKADVNSPSLTGTPTAPTATAGTNTTQIASTAFATAAAAAAFPSGGIIMWSGLISAIPSGWYFCNGSNSTPDLRDRFIIGASADSGGVAKTNITASYTQTGGTKDAIVVSHTHTATSTVADSGHSHNFPNTAIAQNNTGQQGRTDGSQASSMTATSSATTGITVATTNASTGSSGTDQNLPPYYALAFIMKA